MKNNKAVVGILVVVIVLIFGLVTKQAITQFGSSSPFLAQIGKLLMVDQSSEEKLDTNIIRTPQEPPPGGPDSGGEGWTQFTPSATSKIVYISSNGTATGDQCVYTTAGGSRPFGGTDPFNPTNTITPCGGTIQSNYNDKIRNNQDDYLLLKRGDTWNVSGNAITLNKSGFSASRKMVIGSWAPASAPNANRPKIVSPAVSGSRPITNGNSPFNNLAIIDLHLFLNTNTTTPVPGTDGISVWTCASGVGPVSNIHIENMYIERYSFGIAWHNNGCGNRTSNMVFRRNIIADSFNNSSQDSSGLLFFGDNFTLEENIFSHNGQEGNLNGYNSSFRKHNAYLSFESGDMSNLRMEKNWMLRGSDGGKLGSVNGGLIIDNAFLKNAIAILECCENGQIITDNVVIDGANYNPSQARGWGFDLGALSNGQVRRNIFAHQRTGTGDWDIPALLLKAPSTNTQITNNVVYNWCGPTSSNHDGSAMLFSSNGGYSSGLMISDNEFQQDCPSGFVGHVYKEETNLGPVSAQFRNNKYWVNNNNRFVSYGGGMNGPAGNFQTWANATGETGSTLVKITYPDPNRDAATYHNLLFGTNYDFTSDAGLVALDSKLRGQSKWNWDPRLTAGAFNDYIRCGFNKAPLNGTCEGGTTLPTVSLTAPASGATVSGTVTVSAVATHSSPIDRVEFYAGTTLVGTDTTASAGNVYSVNWNTLSPASYPNGPYTLTARAHSGSSVGVSQPRTVTVNNGLSQNCQRIDFDNNNVLNQNDFQAYMNSYTAGEPRADLDGTGVLTANDFQTFLNIYASCRPQ